MNYNKIVSTHLFEEIDERDYVQCTSEICSKPHKFILQNGKILDSFLCYGWEKKGSSGQLDRCMRQFIIEKISM